MSGVLTRCHVLAALFALTMFADTTVAAYRNRRSVSVPFIGSWFGFGAKDKETLPILGNYPLWKVHKYNGIALKPVTITDAGPGVLSLPPAVAGTAPQFVGVPQPISNTYALPPTIYDPRVTFASAGAQQNGNFAASSMASAGAAPTDSGDLGMMMGGADMMAGADAMAGGGLMADADAMAGGDAMAGAAAMAGGDVMAGAAAMVGGDAMAGAAAMAGGDAMPGGSPAGAMAVPGAGTDAETAAALASLSSLGSLIPTGAGAGDLGTLATFAGSLPPSVTKKLSAILRKPGAMDKIVGLLRLWSGKEEKLQKSGKLGYFGKYFNSLVDVEDAVPAATGDIAIASGLYRKVPFIYPGKLAWLKKLPLIGKGVPGITLPDLPPLPVLPKIPGTTVIPNPPELPIINLPSTPFIIPSNVGPYVSLNLGQQQPFQLGQQKPFHLGQQQPFQPIDFEAKPPSTTPPTSPPPPPPMPTTTPPPEEMETTPPEEMMTPPPTTPPTPSSPTPPPYAAYPPLQPIQQPAPYYYAPPPTPVPVYYTPQPMVPIEQPPPQPRYPSQAYGTPTYQTPQYYAKPQYTHQPQYQTPAPTSYEVPIYPAYSSSYQAPVQEYSPPSTYYAPRLGDGFETAASETGVVYATYSDDVADADDEELEIAENDEPSEIRFGNGYSRVALQRASAAFKEKIKARQAAERDRLRTSKSSRRSAESKEDDRSMTPNTDEISENSGGSLSPSQDYKSHQFGSQNNKDN